MFCFYVKYSKLVDHTLHCYSLFKYQLLFIDVVWLVHIIPDFQTIISFLVERPKIGYSFNSFRYLGLNLWTSVPISLKILLKSVSLNTATKIFC